MAANRPVSAAQVHRLVKQLGSKAEGDFGQNFASWPEEEQQSFLRQLKLLNARVPPQRREPVLNSVSLAREYEYKLEQWNFKLKVRGDALRQVYIRSLQPANVEEYAAMTNDAAAARLQRLTELETATGILLLATIFEKGKLFLACRRRWETQGELWQTNCEEILGLSPRQALRYIEFSQLVLALPGLLEIDERFSTLMKHSAKLSAAAVAHSKGEPVHETIVLLAAASAGTRIRFDAELVQQGGILLESHEPDSEALAELQEARADPAYARVPAALDPLSYDAIRHGEPAAPVEAAPVAVAVQQDQPPPYAAQQQPHAQQPNLFVVQTQARRLYDAYLRLSLEENGVQTFIDDLECDDGTRELVMVGGPGINVSLFSDGLHFRHSLDAAWTPFPANQEAAAWCYGTYLAPAAPASAAATDASVSEQLAEMNTN